MAADVAAQLAMQERRKEKQRAVDQEKRELEQIDLELKLLETKVEAAWE